MKKSKVKTVKKKYNNVSNPRHYNSHPAGIECIDVVEHMPFNIGNAIKYLWRHGLKNGKEDMEKSIWYIRREIERVYTKKQLAKIRKKVSSKKKSK